MNAQDIINISIGLVGTLAGWILKNIWDAVAELRADLKDIEHDLHESYVRRDDFKAAIDRIETICNRIFDKLDGKVDKS